MSRPIPIRRPSFDFADVPNDWVGGDQQLTHVINALCVLFPDGEKFFVRTVRAHEDRVDVDPERLRGFYGQEAHHGAAHREQFKMLEQQGYEIASWLRWYHATGYGRIEHRVPLNVRLAAVAALEHFTASLAEVALDPEEIVADMHPEMQALLRWHAVEEIEHKSVAYDVLLQVDPRRRTRLAGFAMATATLMAFGMSAANHLGRQDGLRGTRRRMAAELVKRPRVLRTALAFLRRDFHPDQIDNYGLAEATIADLDAPGREVA